MAASSGTSTSSVALVHAVTAVKGVVASMNGGFTNEKDASVLTNACFEKLKLSPEVSEAALTQALTEVQITRKDIDATQWKNSVLRNVIGSGSRIRRTDSLNHADLSLSTSLQEAATRKRSRN